MRQLRRLAWAAAVAAATASSASAQITGGTTTGGATGGTGGTGGTTGGTGGTGGAAGGTSANQIQLQQLPAAPQIQPPSQYATSGGGAGTGVQASNVFARYYANPYYQGMPSVAMNANSVPGGFGTPLYGTTAGGTGRGGATTGATGGLGRGGVGGAGSNQDVGGVIVPLPVQIAYPAVPQFRVPVATPALQADLRGTIDRTSSIANPAGVQVVMDGNNVTLRGAVKDADEARLAEGLVRLTPGVGNVRNELTYPGK